MRVWYGCRAFHTEPLVLGALTPVRFAEPPPARPRVRGLNDRGCASTSVRTESAHRRFDVPARPLENRP